MDPQKLLLQHFEKALLGGAAIWLLVVLAGYGTKPPEVKKKDSLAGDIKSIRSYVATRSPKKPAIPAWEKEVKKNLSSEYVPQAQEFPTWVLHNRPNVVYRFLTGGTFQDPVHNMPIDVSLRAERGKITVTWKESEENVLISIKEYEVSRKIDDGKFEVVGTVAGDVTEYSDVNVTPRRKYWYKIRSHAKLDDDHPIVSKARSRGLMKELKKELKTADSTAAGPANTPRIAIVMPSLVTPPTEQELFKDIDAPAKVHLKVYKWDPQSPKKWISHSYYGVVVGKKVGKVETKKGRSIDFSSGILESAKVEQRPHPKIKGHKIDCYVITLKYEDGSKETFNNLERPEEIKDVK